MTSVIDIKSVPEKYQKALRKADSCGDKEKQFNDRIDQDCEVLAAATNISGNDHKDVAKAEAYLRQVLGIGTAKEPAKVEGTEMVGKPEFNLVDGKIYGYNGSQVAVSGNKFQVTYKSDQYSGAVHEYDGGGWNGKPIDLKNYSKLSIVIEVKEGDIANTKFELNNREILTYGALKNGLNEIDLNALKKDDFAPTKEMQKFNFVNKSGAGKYIVRLVIK